MSEVGLELKKTNPGAYMNVVAHMQMHDFQVQMAAQAEAEAEGEDDVQSKKDDGSGPPSGS